DSSHLPEFTKRINALHAAAQTPCVVTSFWSGHGHDMPADDVAKWKMATQQLGAHEARSINELLDNVDAIMVLAVNGHRHFELARPALERGLPTYIDKPLTCD